MGTRALILKDGVPFLGTHWDGNPDSLGRELLEGTMEGVRLLDDERLIGIGIGHCVDYAHKDYLRLLDAIRTRSISQRHNLSETEVNAGYRRGMVHGPDDGQIADVADYSDAANYVYDLRGGKELYVRKQEEWLKLSESGVPTDGFEPLKEYLEQLDKETEE
jgi:hypothetical protein